MIGARLARCRRHTQTANRLRLFASRSFFRMRSETAPIGRYSIITVQLRFLRAIAPIEILVGAE